MYRVFDRKWNLIGVMPISTEEKYLKLSMRYILVAV